MDRPRLLTALWFSAMVMFIGAGSTNGSPDSLLVLLKGVDVAQLRQVPSFVVYHFDEGSALGAVNPADTSLLRGLAKSMKVIPEVSPREPTFWVKGKGGRLDRVALSGAQVLVSDEDEAIVQVDFGRAAELVRSGFELELVDWIPKPLPLPSVPASLATVSYDSSVADIVDQVSITSIRNVLQRLQDFQTRYTLSDSIIPAGQWIYDLYVSFGYTDVRFDTFYIQGVPHRNIIATKRGVIFPDSVIMLGGHYDSIVLGAGTNPYLWAPGADDNGSGTVAALEAARVLAGHKFEATIQFAAWDGEELGLLGSSAFAEKLRQRKLPMSLYINFDMIGNLDPVNPHWSVRIFADRQSQPFAEFIAEMAQTYTTLEPLLPGNSGGSDHRPFQMRGYPAVFVHEADFSPNWHKPTDTVDNVNFDYFREVIQTGVAAAAHLAGLADNFGDAPYAKYYSHTLNDDQIGASYGNSNGYVDAGERLEIYVRVKNYGVRTASGLRGKLSSDDPHVQVLTDSVSFPDAAPGALVDSQGPFVVQIASNVPNGWEIPFRVTTLDSRGDRWVANFKLRVQMPDLEFFQQVVRQVRGDGDELVEPGEKWSVRVKVHNLGLRSTGQLTGVLRSLGPEIVVLDSVANFGRAYKGDFAENSADSLLILVTERAQEGQIVPMELRFTEEGGFFQDVVRLNIAVGQGNILLVEDNGEDAFGEYYTSALNHFGIPYRYWDTAVEGSVPLDTLQNYKRVVWFVGTEYGNSLFRDGTDALESYLANGGRLFLSGPAAIFVLRSRPLFSSYLMTRYVNFNTGLHHLTTRGSNEVLGDISFWLAKDGPNKQGMPTEIDVSEPAQAVLFYDQGTSEGQGDIRAQGAAAAAVSHDGYKAVYFAFGWEGIADEQKRRTVLVRVLNWLQSDVSSVEELTSAQPLQFELAQNYPNPFNPETKIVYTLTRASHVKLVICDVRGRVVRVLSDELKKAGRHAVTWDGKDDQGRPLPSGMYLYRLDAQGRRAVRKMVLIR